MTPIFADAERPRQWARARQATLLLFFVSGVAIASWASRIPDVQRHLGLSDGQLGVALIAALAQEGAPVLPGHHAEAA